VVARALALALVLALGAARAIDAHPLHTTLTEVVEDRSAGVLKITVRAFVDDFALAAGKHSRIAVGANHTIPESVMMAYVSSTVRALDAKGGVLQLRWVGFRRQGDVIWLTMLVPRPAGAVRVRNAMLFDLYDDQVNIVQSAIDGRRESKLFTKNG
jgi:hypothetical protein